MIRKISLNDEVCSPDKGVMTSLKRTLVRSFPCVKSLMSLEMRTLAVLLATVRIGTNIALLDCLLDFLVMFNSFIV